LNNPLEGKKKTQISLSLTLSFEEDEEKKGTNRDGVVPVARLRISLTLSFVFEIERTLRRDERKKTNKISPQRNKGKEEISLGHPKKKKKKKRIRE
jgi:hypothetical protein